MKGMTNNQIILNEAEKLAPATLHAIATAHHTAAEIEALAAQITVTEDDGTKHPGTIHDAEIMLAASELHTFDYWKKEGKSVKKYEKALIECYLWKYTTKPSKAQREAAEAEGKEAAPDPHYYPTKSHLFSCLQVESSKPAPEARFKSTAEIIAYNKKLAAERKAAKAAKEAAAKAAAEQADTKTALDVLKQTERKAKAAFMAVPETDRKAQAEALSVWRKARQDVADAEKPTAPAVNMKELETAFNAHYSTLYRTHDDHDSSEYNDAVERFDELSGNDPQFTATVQAFTNYRSDFISSDREAAAFVMALDELEAKRSTPEMVPEVQQLCFA